MTANASPGYLEALWQGWEELRRWAGLLGPVTSLPFGLDPVAALGAALALVVTAGLAVASLAVLLTSLLVLYLLLTEVFGVRFELALPRGL